MALVEVSVVEQRYQAVLAVQSGAPVVDVAARFAVSRQSVHNWLAAYRDGGLAGLEARSRRPDSSPWVELKVVTAVDDHSRFCVCAKVVRRATGRAVCPAFAEAMTRYGVPEAVLETRSSR